jgi:hypothetical protein
MTYSITKQIRILHEQNDWDFVFETNEYGTAVISCHEGLEAFAGKTSGIRIPKDCIQHFIDALEQLK